MADLDELCDLLDDEYDEEKEEEKCLKNVRDNEKKSILQESERDPEELELEAMLLKVKEMKEKLAVKKQKYSEVNIFSHNSVKESSPVKTNPFIEKPNKSIKLYQKTPSYGPALATKTTRVITGIEKEQLLARIQSAESLVRADLAQSSDDENFLPYHTEKNISKTGSDKKKYCSKDQNLRSTNILVEKHSRLRIVNPLLTQEKLNLNLVNRQMIRMCTLEQAIQRGETKGDWTTMGIIFLKSSKTTKKAGNMFTIMKMTDLSIVNSDIKSITLMLFGQAHLTHYKIPLNKVIGILNAKILEDRGGRGEITLSVDHPDKILEIGDSHDIGKCIAIKSDGSGCTNIVNKSECEHCLYHVKKAYKSMSAKRGEIQSSFSGTTSQSRIMSKIAPKGEIFAGGQILNQMPSSIPGKGSSKLKAKDLKALRGLGVTTSTTAISSISKASHTSSGAQTLEILSKIESATHLSIEEKESVRKMIREGLSNDMSQRLLRPTPGSKLLLKHLSKQKEEEKRQEKDSSSSSLRPLTVTSILSTHRVKLENENKVKRLIESRSKIASSNYASTPKLGRGVEKGFIYLNDSKSKALITLQAKGSSFLQKKDPNGKRKRADNENLKNIRREKVAKVLNSSNEHPRVLDVPQQTDLTEEKMTQLRHLKSKNASLLTEHENEEVEKYFNVLEKKDGMEEKMIQTKEMKTKALSCSVCNYTAFTQSDLCKERSHVINIVTVLKKFFECTNCKKRQICLDKYPKTTCSHCGGSSWKRTGMMKEKKVLLEHEKLCIRGIEQKFIESNVISSQFDL